MSERLTAEEIELEHAAKLIEEWNERGRKARAALDEAIAAFTGCSCVLCVSRREEKAKHAIRKAQQLLTE